MLHDKQLVKLKPSIDFLPYRMLFFSHQNVSNLMTLERFQTEYFSFTSFMTSMHSMRCVPKSMAGKPALKETLSILVPSSVPLDSTPTTHHTYTSPCYEWRILTWNIITQRPLGNVQRSGSRPNGAPQMEGYPYTQSGQCRLLHQLAVAPA